LAEQIGPRQLPSDLSCGGRVECRVGEPGDRRVRDFDLEKLISALKRLRGFALWGSPKNCLGSFRGIGGFPLRIGGEFCLCLLLEQRHRLNIPGPLPSCPGF
jgi:hypothetical protein